MLQGAGDQSILGLDGIELTTRPLGFEASPLDGQLEHRDMSTMVGVGFSKRLGGGRQAGRLEHGEDLVEHAVLEPAPAEALAASFAAIERLVAATEIPRRVAGRAGVANLHHPPTASAADPTLQQGRSFTRRTTTVAAGRPPVGTELVLGALIALPGDKAGVVVRDQDLPLLARQLTRVLHEPAVDVQTPLVSSPAEHEGAT